MFGMGMGELIVILIIALLFLGPAKLPEVATSLGKAIRQFRRATQDLTDQFQIDDDVKAPLRELQAALRNDPEPYVVMAAKSAVARGPLDQRTPAAPLDQQMTAAAGLPAASTAPVVNGVTSEPSADMQELAAMATPAPASETAVATSTPTPTTKA